MKFNLDKFKQQLYKDTVKAVKKYGRVPEWLDYGKIDAEDINAKMIEKKINSITERQYKMWVQSTLEGQEGESLRNIKKNVPRAVISKLNREYSTHHAHGIQDVFREFVSPEEVPSINDIRFGKIDWNKYKDVYHNLRTSGMSIAEIQAFVWGSK